jgi:DeoR/GlpR family transcriptional regulator of sugar metabolism
MRNRREEIIEYVSRNGKVEVSALAEHFGISKVTVRKDLDLLADKGLLKRERGYAVLNDPDDINYKMAFNYEIKKKIAKAATAFVEQGETVLVEAGSTCVLFAEELAKAGKNVTIVTNSVHVADYIKDIAGAEIVLLGGSYQKKRQDVVGPMTKMCVQSYHVDKIFVGTDGYSRENGFTADDLNRSDTLTAMIRSANHTFVLTESEKFLKSGSVPFLQFKDVYELITDDGISQEDRKFLEKKGVHITLV